MQVLGWVLLAGVGGLLALYIVGRLLPAKITGKTYLKKMIWQNGVDWRSIPNTCIQEFVADALQYAKQVSSVTANPVIPKRHFHLEFERKLMVHAAGVAAIIKGEGRGDVWKEQETVLRKHGVQAVSSQQPATKEPELAMEPTDIDEMNRDAWNRQMADIIGELGTHDPAVRICLYREHTYNIDAPPLFTAHPNELQSTLSRLSAEFGGGTFWVIVFVGNQIRRRFVLNAKQ